MQPTLAGFITFLYTVVGIPTGALPNTAPVISMAYNVALDIVNQTLACGGTYIYELAVYNLGADNVINYAQDTPPSTYFKDTRSNFNIATFVPGVVTSTADESTSTSLLNPDFMKSLTLGNLANLKTPWGRTYLGFAQDYGVIWGLT